MTEEYRTMTEDEKVLASIRKRDTELGEEIPGHWTAQVDRRNLLRLLDEAKREINTLYRYLEK